MSSTTTGVEPAADRECEIALILAADDSIVLFFAGRQSMILGRWDDATEIFERRAGIGSAQSQLVPELYLLQLRRGRLAEVAQPFAALSRSAPHTTSRRCNLGIVLLTRRGQPEAAMAEMMKEGR